MLRRPMYEAEGELPRSKIGLSQTQPAKLLLAMSEAFVGLARDQDPLDLLWNNTEAL
jgi:hypothetical protein